MRRRLAEGARAFKMVDPAHPDGVAAAAMWTPPGDGGGLPASGVGGDGRPRCVDGAVLEGQVKRFEEARERVFGESRDFWCKFLRWGLGFSADWLDLALLFSDPDYQGKGLGSALVRWGMAQAEKDGVPVYTEASSVGKSLYAKLGFEEVEEIDLTSLIPDGRQYKLACMIWMPKDKAQ